MDPIDIWRTAHLLMKEYGEEASLIAAKRADALLAEGDMAGFRVWQAVLKALGELARTEAGEGESVNYG